MPASQEHVSADTPMGANIVADGATFRVWAPTAAAVHLALHGPGQQPDQWAPNDDNKLVRNAKGYWSGFFPGVTDGTPYRFWTVGPAGLQGYKRDPRASELELRGYPDCGGIVRGANDYPWHDAGFRLPPFNELIIYQLHVGVFYASDGQHDIRQNRVSKFLDVLDRLEYLADLGVNAIQPLPVVEWQGSRQPRLQQHGLLLPGDGLRPRSRRAGAVPGEDQRAPAQERQVRAARRASRTIRSISSRR